MNYKVIETEHGFAVFEQKTTRLIKIYENRAEAEDACKFYNLGGGFDGHTPGFMLTEVDIDGLGLGYGTPSLLKE